MRVAGPFTVDSLSPHRTLAVDEDDELIDHAAEPRTAYGEAADFASMILEQLKTAGVQQAHKDDRITFNALIPWPGRRICGEGRYAQGDEGREQRAGVFIGPEFGTVSRPDLVAAAREAGDADFDVLIACAFNYDAHSSEFDKLGRIPVLKARMNADLHMAEDLKNTGKGNLFVIFGEPDIDVLPAEGDDAGRLQVRINGVDVFLPNTGEIRSDGPEGIACWFIDTDYNEESFFVRHAYFLGANDPYKALRTTLKAEVDPDAWATLHSDLSRPFDKPASGRIAVKVINHLGDEVILPVAQKAIENASLCCDSRVERMPRWCSLSSLEVNMNWTVQCAEYHLYRSVSRTNAYEFMQQSGDEGVSGVNPLVFHRSLPVESSAKRRRLVRRPAFGSGDTGLAPLPAEPRTRWRGIVCRSASRFRSYCRFRMDYPGRGKRIPRTQEALEAWSSRGSI